MATDWDSISEVFKRIFQELGLEEDGCQKCKVLCTDVQDDYGIYLKEYSDQELLPGQERAARHYFQPLPSKVHLFDQTNQRFCQILFEEFECAAVQIVPPVLYNESSAASSWAELVQIAQSIPDTFVDTENSDTQDGAAVDGVFSHTDIHEGDLLSRQVPWIWRRREVAEGLLSPGKRVIEYDDLGPYTVTAFQPRGRLSDVWEET